MSETDPSDQAPIEEPPRDEEGNPRDVEASTGEDVLSDEELANAQAHCPHCLEPTTSADYYCPKCYKPVGQLTGYLPLINVPLQAQFLGSMWRTIWSDNAGWGLRILCAVVLVPLAPIVVIIGLSAVLWRRISSYLRRQ